MSVIQNNLLLSGDDAYNLQRSLRFRSSASAYLSRTPASAGNSRTFTFSCWVKRGALSGVRQVLFGASDINANPGGFSIFFNTDNTLLVRDSGGVAIDLTTTAVYRDPSAWYHIVLAIDTTQATNTNRVKLYVNGSQVTAFSTTTYPSQNHITRVNNPSFVNYIGAVVDTSLRYYLDGYMTEINFIDGQALTPSSFGENNAQTGVWQPKRYTGTYGTNGFYLPFSDNSSLSNLTADRSGNGNNWTANNISLTAGATYDSMTDVPTLTSATQANFATLNPLFNTGALGLLPLLNGNLTANEQSGNSAYRTRWSTIGITSGKFYAEFTISYSGATSVASAGGVAVGLYDGGSATYVGQTTTTYGYFSNGQKFNNNSASSYGATYANGDVIGIAYDADAGTLTFFKNGVSQGVAYSSIPSGTYFLAVSAVWVSPDGTTNINANFGQRPFAYTPPTGFVALNTFNLPTPTIGATASTQADNYFDAKTYTGTGATQTITVDFASDFAWLKRRDGAGENVLLDRLRLTGSLPNRLFSNSTAAESTAADGQNSFSSSGIVLDGSGGGGGEVNTSGRTYVAWQWRANGTGVTNTAGSITSTVSANTSSGFSIVTYTGNGSAGATVGHGLGVAPAMVIIKSRTNGSADWQVFHKMMNNGSSPWNYSMYLNGTSAQISYTGFNNTAPTSSLFTLGSNGGVNQSSNNFVAYCFAEVAGFSRFGSYTGNGSADGPFVFCGFRPRYVMVKSTGASNWFVWDTSRNTFNATTTPLFPNNSGAEEATLYPIDILSNGFKLRGAAGLGINESATYIFMAFAENPFKYSLAR